MVSAALTWEPQAERSHIAKCRERFGLLPHEALRTVLNQATKAWLGPNSAPSAHGTLALVVACQGRHAVIPLFIPGLPRGVALAEAARWLRCRGGFVRSVFWADEPPGGGNWESWKKRAIKLL